MIRVLYKGRHRIPDRQPPAGPDADAIRAIIHEVRRRGDAAVSEFEERFGGAPGPLRVSRDAIKAAYKSVPADTLEAIRNMAHQLRSAEQMLRDALKSIPSPQGMQRTFAAIPSVGCYIPGGGARYPSTAVMSVVPAAVAGVPRIVAVSPNMDDATMVAADTCGATELYSVGGAQAVAALAYGIKSILPVDKIVGPGGPVVTAAKRQVGQDVAVDMNAGPTELGIISDGTVDDTLVSLDMISQAEHGTETFCFLLTTSAKQAESVARTIESRLGSIERAETVRASLYGNGFIMVFDGISSALQAAEDMAPEHLQVMTANPLDDAKHLHSPGLILLGSQTPSAASDYMLGSNHILPTGGQGRLRGQLSVLDFVKMQTTLQAPAERLYHILKGLREITAAEGLVNHYEAVRGRTI